MAERVRVREISNKEGQRLLRMVRRSSGADPLERRCLSWTCGSWH